MVISEQMMSAQQKKRNYKNRIIYLKNHNSKRDMYHSVHCSTIYNRQDMEPT